MGYIFLYQKIGEIGKLYEYGLVKGAKRTAEDIVKS